MREAAISLQYNFAEQNWRPPQKQNAWTATDLSVIRLYDTILDNFIISRFFSQIRSNDRDFLVPIPGIVINNRRNVLIVLRSAKL